MFKVKFADIGEGLTEGKVIEVFVKIGDTVKEGDSLFSVETDKVNADIPAPTSGKISGISVKPDQDINVGDVVMEIDDGTGPSTEPVQNASTNVEEEENASVVGATPVSNDVIPSRGPAPVKTSSSLPTSNPTSTVNNATPNPEIKVEASYDVIVIGAGTGGYVAAIKAAQLGLKTLIIEKEYYGGVCLNVGCIPTKTLLRTAKVYDDILTKAGNLGISISATPTIDWTKTMDRKNNVVKKLTGGVKSLLTKNKVDQIIGEAKAIDKNHIEVNGKNYFTKNLIIATGSVPNALPLPGFDEARKAGIVLNSTGMLSIKELPKTLTIVGGGVIGVEFAGLFASLGTKVTIVQALSTILEMLDKDVIDLMTKELKSKYKINIITNAKVLEIKDHELFFEVDGQKQSLVSDYVLESVGRKTVNIGFENIGLALTERKAIVVNEYLETNVDGVYAIGDVLGKVMLAHAASHAGIVAANRIAMKANLKAEKLVMNFDRVPSNVYTHPEVSMIGKTEQQLKAAGTEYKAYKFPFAAVGKALADDDPTGFVKIMVDPKFKSILGAHIVGNRATDMISEFGAVIESEGTVSELASMIHPHPSMSEAIGEVAESLETGKAINI